MKVRIRIGGYAIDALIHRFQRVIFTYFNYCMRHKKSTFVSNMQNVCFDCDEEQFQGFLKEAFK